MYILYVYQQNQPTRLQIKRENKLEKLMQQSLIGKCLTMMVITTSLYFLVESVDVVWIVHS